MCEVRKRYAIAYFLYTGQHISFCYTARMHSTEGIVLKKLDVGEHDALYAIYTKDYGKVKTLAQGVRKEEAKLRGHLEPLSRARIQFVIGRGGEKLIGATLADFFPRMRARETTLRLAAAAAADIDARTFPGERDDGVWRLIAETFAALDAEDFYESETTFLVGFRSRLREVLGYGASDEEEIR